MYAEVDRRVALSAAILAVALLPSRAKVYAHGIADNRYFPGTLTFDHPAVADELFMPLYSRLEHPTVEGMSASSIK